MRAVYLTSVWVHVMAAATLIGSMVSFVLVVLPCAWCHVLSVYGLANPAATGPDLSVAVEDVPRRFGRPLEEFLRGQRRT